MKKYLLFLFILCLFTGKSFAQFSIDKFLNEKLVFPNRDTELNMDKLMQGAVDAKLEKIPIKVLNAKLKNGNIYIQTIANSNLKDADAKKLNDVLKKILVKKLGDISKENTVNGVKNNVWKKGDGTTYMLTYSGNMCMLVVMRK